MVDFEPLLQFKCAEGLNLMWWSWRPEDMLSWTWALKIVSKGLFNVGQDSWGPYWSHNCGQRYQTFHVSMKIWTWTIHSCLNLACDWATDTSHTWKKVKLESHKPINIAKNTIFVWSQFPLCWISELSSNLFHTITMIQNEFTASSLDALYFHLNKTVLQVFNTIEM